MHRLADQRGFTLIEILVVVVIIAILAALVGPRLFGKVGEAKRKAASAQIELFRQALGTYRLDVGRYPTTAEGLEALMEQPSGLDTWVGPYLVKAVPKDPWGNAYIYRSPGENGDMDIISYGSDGAPGGDGENKDIVSWENL
ncbi:MAG: type II secretion system major pseudopilin GspG [Nitrospinae bacterium]|nr:type II secretion system major pseudopilin GspG [Nitrospinota bacterium]